MLRSLARSPAQMVPPKSNDVSGLVGWNKTAVKLGLQVHMSNVKLTSKTLDSYGAEFGRSTK